MDRETGSGGSHRDRRPAGDGGAPDRLGELRGRLAGRAARLRDRARQRWRERTEPGPLGDPPPAVWEGATPPGDSPATGGHPRQGSLRSRLLWSFVGVAALAALIVGIVTLSLVRLASVNGLEQQLRDQAAAASTIGGGPAPCTILVALRAVQTELYLVASDGSPQAVTCQRFRGRLAGPVAPAPDVDLRADLNEGAVKTGSRGSIVYAVAPLQQPVQDLRGVRYDGVLLTHSLGGLGIGLVSAVDADVTAVLREAVPAAAERAAAQGVSVEQQVPDGPLLARVDPGRLRQVLDNLLDNATRSSPAGYPVLVAARLLPGGWVEVAVVDRGPGIATEDLPRAFDRGYLWSRYRGTRTVGSGLGLAIVKALCDAMGVTVRAESGRESGRAGTAFRLALPPARSSRPSWAASGHGLPTPR